MSCGDFEWTVIRRRDVARRLSHFAVPVSTSPTCVNTVLRRRPAPTGTSPHACRSLTSANDRRVRSRGAVSAGFSPSADFGVHPGCARSRRHRLRARAPADAPRQPRRCDVLRRQGRHGYFLFGSGRRHVLHIMHGDGASATDLGDLFWICVSDDAPAVGGDRRFGFHQRARVGGIRLPTWPNATKGGRRPAVRSARNELPDLGLLVIQDAETGEQIFVDTHDRGFRTRFAEAAERRGGRVRGPRCVTPASTRWNCPPKTIWSMRICVFGSAQTAAAQLAAGGSMRMGGRRMTFLWPEMLWAWPSYCRCSSR